MRSRRRYHLHGVNDTDAGQPPPEWWNVVGQFRAKVDEFENNYQGLLAQRDFVQTRPALAAKWNQMVQDGAAIRRSNQDILDKIDAVENAVGQAVDTVESGASSAWDWIKSQVGLSGLGFVMVLVPIAVIVTALAAIAKWSLDALNFSKTLEETRRLEATGVAPATAAEIVATQRGNTTGSPFSFLGFQINPWFVVGGFALAFGPQIISSVRSAVRSARK